MSDVKRHPMTLKPVLYTMPGMAEVVTREVAYGDGLAIDLYTPPAASGRLPAVVFVTGYADPGSEQVFGCKLKDMASYVSWARLVAASGMIGVTYENRQASDAHAMLAHLRANAAALGIDDQRIAIWGCSGNAPMALSLLDGARCAALSYPFMGDLGGGTETAKAAAMFRFAAPAITLDQLPNIPMFIARAGRDEMPGLNASIDRFIPAAIERGLPVTLTNHPTGPHSFDLVDDSETTRAVVRQLLAFLQIQLLA
jgi:dienelactone hydrolase